MGNLRFASGEGFLGPLARGGVCGLAMVAVAASVTWFLQPPAVTKDQLLSMGLAAAEWGEFSVARSVVRGLQEKGCEEEAALVLAKTLISKGFYQPAVDVLSAVESESLETRRWLLLAEVAQWEGRHRAVEEMLKPLLQVQPELLDAHRLLSVSYYDLGAIDGALEHLTAVGRLDPNDPRPMRLLGLIHSDYELYAEAIPFYVESLRRSPGQPDRDDLLLELATCQEKQRQYSEAIDTLAQRPSSPAGELLKAKCLLALGNREEAQAAVVAVLRGDPNDIEALLLQGTILLEDGDVQAAIEPLRHAASDQNHYLAHVTFAKALAAVGRDEEAGREQETAARIRETRQKFADLHKEAWENPQDADVRWQLAETAANLGRPYLEAVWKAAARSLSETQ